MKKLFTTFIGLVMLMPVMAQAPAGYYNSAQGLTGLELKTALYNIIKGHTEYPYSDATTDTWDILKETDRDPNNANNVIGLYSNFSMNGPLEYDGGNGWTREHVWAKSRGDFGTLPGPGTDVHHLRAEDASVNSARGNRNFDEATEPYVDASGQYSGATGSFTGGSAAFTWEPRAEVKGDVARMMFYMATRYEGDGTEPDLELVEYLLDQADKSPVHAKLSVLLAWHAADPVDAMELNRNDIIYGYQGNRNPFIDHPEYVSAIWGNIPAPTINFNSSPVTAATEDSPYSYTATTVNASGAVTLSATTVPAFLTFTDNGNGTAILTGTPVAGDAGSYTISISASDTQNTVTQTYTLVVNTAGGGGGTPGGGGGSGSSGGQSTELLISEYIEGSSFNKGLEIANFTGANVDLTPYSIATQVNGATTWGTAYGLTGTVVDGDVFVIVHTSANATMQAAADVLYGGAAMSFNGNDVIGLFKNGVLIDKIGVTGSTANFAQDVTKVRNPDVTNPTDVYDATQWTDLATDTFTELGSHTMDLPALATELLFSEYIEGSSYNKGLEIANFTGADVDLTPYTIATQVNGATTWGTAYNPTGTVLNGDVFVVVHTSANAAMQAAADDLNGGTALGFNGNDVVGLFKDGILIDKIGVTGSTANFAQDVTKVRNATVNAPTDVYDATEWTDLATDTFTELGTHTMEGGGGSTPTAPAAPSASISATQTSLLVTWGDVSNEDSYEVYRSTDGSTFSLVSTEVANTTSYSDATVAQGTTYFYYITATNAVGTSAASNTVSATPTTPPVSNGPEFDVVTFNVEWLGSPSQAGLAISRDQQLTDAALDILDANADVVALQEMVIDPVNGDALADLLTKLNSLDTDTWAGGYNQYFSYWWAPDFNTFPAQRQAFVYRTSTVSNVTFQTLLTAEVPSGDSRFASGRLPFMMSGTVTIDGVSEPINLINLHLKCCTGNAARRLASMQTLDAELEANWANSNVIILGDFNVADNGGATGEIATWGLYDDSNNDGTADYQHAAGAKTDLAWEDIDHILISDEWNDEFAGTDVAKQNVTLTTRNSDHNPIKTTLTLQGVATGDTQAPTAPTALSAANVTETGFTLSWTASTDNVGVTGYEVFQDGVSIGTTATTSLAVTGLTAASTYSYTVVAQDAASNVSAASTALNVTTATPAGDTQAPTAPTALSAANVTETGFTLSWTAATDNVGVTGYEVFQDGVSIGTTATTSFAVGGLTAATTYSYTVVAQDAASNVSAASTALNVTTASPAVAQLYFSEYVEGTSFNKALEIANSTGTAVDMTGYTVARQTNGTGAWGAAYALTGTIANADVFVIVHTSADISLQAYGDVTYGGDAMNFNGDDAVGLFKDGVLIDILGTFNSAVTYGQDVTLRRNDNITAGSTTYAAADWTSFATDTFGGLGQRITNGGGTGGSTVLGTYSFETGLEGWTEGGADASLYSGSYSWDGGNSIQLRDNSGAASSVISPVYDLSGFDQVELDFHFIPRSLDNSNEDLIVEYNDGSGWSIMASYAEGIDIVNETFYQATLTLDATTSNLTSAAQFRFRCDASGNNDWVYVDLVTVTGTSGVVARGVHGPALSVVGEMAAPAMFTVENSLEAYPNPAAGETTLSIALTEAEAVTLTVYNLQGQAVYSRALNLPAGTTNHTLAVDTLEAGMYMVQVAGSESRQTLRLVIQ